MSSGRKNEAKSQRGSDGMNLEGKVALITGGSSGLGWGAAKVLAEQGASVVIAGRTQSSLDKAVSKLREAGHEARAVKVDIRRYEELEAAVEEIDEGFGRLDILYANAGVNGVWAPLEELTLQEWKETLDINLSGTFYTIKSCLPLLKRNGGSVVITSSVNGTRMFSNTGATAYATSKAGQVALAKMLALELAPSGIRVNVICPGWMESEIEENTEKRDLEKVATPVEFPEGAVPLKHGSPGKAVEVGNLVAFLSSDLASHITGTEVWIDGAQSLLQG